MYMAGLNGITARSASCSAERTRRRKVRSDKSLRTGSGCPSVGLSSGRLNPATIHRVRVATSGSPATPPTCVRHDSSNSMLVYVPCSLNPRSLTLMLRLTDAPTGHVTIPANTLPTLTKCPTASAAANTERPMPIRRARFVTARDFMRPPPCRRRRWACCRIQGMAFRLAWRGGRSRSASSIRPQVGPAD